MSKSRSRLLKQLLFPAVATLMLLSACGGGTRSGTASLDIVAAPSGSPAENELSFPDGTADGFPAVPDSVDPVLWSELTSRLAEQLQEYGTQRRSSEAPMGDANQVSDLVLEESSGMLQWTLQSSGDYDQNGEVNIADLVPLALHFSQHAENTGNPALSLLHDANSGGFARDSVESVVDGDGNGEINIADVTPIGLYFHNGISGYRVYGSTSWQDYPASDSEPSRITALAELPLASALGNSASGRLSFEYELDTVQPEMAYWVRPYQGDSEGVASILAGNTALLPSSSLSFSGISPASATPGSIVRLEFNQPLKAFADDLTIRIADEVVVGMEALISSGPVVFLAVPPVNPGSIGIEALIDGKSAGSQVLQVLPAQPATSPEQAQQMLAQASLSLSGIFQVRITRSAESDPLFDSAAAQLELAAMDSTLADLGELWLEETSKLDPQAKAQLMAYLEGTGQLEILQALGALGGKSTSRLSHDNWDMLSQDTLSMLISDSGWYVDLASISAAILLQPQIVVAIMGFKVFLALYDNVIDTFLPTDLIDVRVSSQMNDCPLAPVSTELRLEGLFCTEKEVGTGTIDTITEVLFSVLPIPIAIKNVALNTVISVLASKLGENFTKNFWKSGVEYIWEPIGDPSDPCYLHLRAEWLPLDINLYRKAEYSSILNNVFRVNFQSYAGMYPIGVYSGYQPISFSGSAGFNMNMYSSSDSIFFPLAGEYTCSARFLSWRRTVKGLLYDSTELEFVDREFPFFAGQYATWRATPVETGGTAWKYHSIADCAGSPGVLFYPNDYNEQVAFRRATDSNGSEWGDLVVVDTPGIYFSYFTRLTSVNDKPAILYWSGIGSKRDFHYLQAKDEEGSAWYAPALVASQLPDAFDFLLGEWQGVPVCFISHYGGSGLDNIDIYRALDADGRLWDNPKYVTQFSSGISGGNTSNLAMLDGMPAFLNRTRVGTGNNYRLDFIRGMDGTGENWQHSVVATELLASGSTLSLAVIDGHPAATYLKLDQPAVYNRAQDSAGTIWGPEQPLPQEVEWVYELHEVNLLPAFVAARSLPPQQHFSLELAWFQAGTADGMSWPVVQSMYYPEWSGKHGSTALIGGRPYFITVGEHVSDGVAMLLTPPAIWP